MTLSSCKTFHIKNEFDLPENEPVGGTQFHLNGFARRLVLAQRLKTTREWPSYAIFKRKGTVVFGSLI